MSTLTDLVHSVLVAWVEGMRWRLAQFEGPLFERCPRCASGGCDTARRPK